MAPNTPPEPPRSIRLSDAELKAIVTDTVHQTFVTLGVDAKSPIEMQKDFQHLRDWRQTTDAVKRKGILTLAGLIVAGLAALVWVTFTGGDHPA